MSLRVAYDISILAEQFSRVPIKTGIPRATEELLDQLRHREDVEPSVVTLCAQDPVAASVFAIHYARSRERNGSRPLRTAHSFHSRFGLADFYRMAYGKYYSSEIQALPRFSPRSVALRGSLRLLRRWTRIDAYRHFSYTDFDLFHSSYLRLPPRELTGRLPRVLTVYDLIPVLAPHFVPRDSVPFFQSILDSISERDWIVCISQFTKSELCEYAGIAPERVAVTPLAAARQFRRVHDEEAIAAARRRYGVPEGKYLLSISTIEPRKNLVHLIRCFARLLQEHPEPDLYLVLVGAKGPLHAEVTATAMRFPELRSRVLFTGYIPDEDLSAIYSGALAFVYPSLYEGFGLPPLEAMQCGVPVITSNTSSLPEVIGDAGILVDPRDADALCAAMLQLVQDRVYRHELRQRGWERAHQFTWERCAAATVDLYRRAAEGRD